LDSCDIAGIKCNRLINEGTAIALSYGFFRQNELNPTRPRKVCFIDFGHSKLTITFAAFVPGKTKIIATHSDRNLGARRIDYLVFDKFA
jgi:heat shock 70kDa protein 4